MYGFDCLPARPFSNTEDQAVFFVKPVRVVLHTVPLLDSHVLSMGLGDVLWRGSRTWWRSMYIGTGSRYTLVAGRSMSESGPDADRRIGGI